MLKQACNFLLQKKKKISKKLNFVMACGAVPLNKIYFYKVGVYYTLKILNQILKHSHKH